MYQADEQIEENSPGLKVETEDSFSDLKQDFQMLTLSIKDSMRQFAAIKIEYETYDGFIKARMDSTGAQQARLTVDRLQHFSMHKVHDEFNVVTQMVHGHRTLMSNNISSILPRFNTMRALLRF